MRTGRRSRSGPAGSSQPLPDHHDYATLPWPADTPDAIVTEKDAVKLPPQRPLGATRVWVARLDFRLDPTTEAALGALLPRPPRASEE